jgi:multiple sugar transport system substrate-binding protein
MSKKLRLVVALALCIVMLGTLFAGCQKKDPGTGTDTTDTAQTGTDQSDTSAEKTTINFWFYPRYVVEGKENGVYEQELIDAYVKDNPNVNIEYEMIAWNQGPEKINIAISSNAMPDSVFDFPGRIIGYGAQGVLADLSFMFTDEDRTDIPQSILDHCMLGDKIYMYPTHISPVIMGVNRKLFRDAGAEDLLPLDDPNNPDRLWSIDEFQKALEAIRDNLNNVAPIVFYAGNEQGDASIRMFIQNFGTDFVNKEHDKVVINSEEGVRGLQWILDAYKNGLIAKGAESLTSTDALDMFTQGAAAMCILYGPGNMNTLNKAIAEGKAAEGFDFAFVPQPSADGKSVKVEAQVIGYCIFDNKDQKRIEESAKFIEYLAKDPKNVLASGAFPVRQSMGELYDHPELSYAGNISKYVDDTGYTINNYAKVRALWYPELQAALTGEKTAKQALDDFAAKATEAMNEK